MAITPITATAQLDILYTTVGVQHRCQLRCNTSGLSGGFYTLSQYSGSAILASDAAEMFLEKISPLYETSETTFDGYELQQYDAGRYLPLEGQFTDTEPSGATPAGLAQQNTYTFRNANYELIRVVLLDSAEGPVSKKAYTALGAASKALVDSIILNTDAHIGSWFRGRDGALPPKQFTYGVNSYNRKQRRIRGMV